MKNIENVGWIQVLWDLFDFDTTTFVLTHTCTCIYRKFSQQTTSFLVKTFENQRKQPRRGSEKIFESLWRQKCHDNLYLNFDDMKRKEKNVLMKKFLVRLGQNSNESYAYTSELLRLWFCSLREMGDGWNEIFCLLLHLTSILSHIMKLSVCVRWWMSLNHSWRERQSFEFKKKCVPLSGRFKVEHNWRRSQRAGTKTSASSICTMYCTIVN